MKILENLGEKLGGKLDKMQSKLKDRTNDIEDILNCTRRNENSDNLHLSVSNVMVLLFYSLVAGIAVFLIGTLFGISTLLFLGGATFLGIILCAYFKIIRHLK